MDECCSLANRDTIAFLCENENTEQLELRFRAVLGKSVRAVGVAWGRG